MVKRMLIYINIYHDIQIYYTQLKKQKNNCLNIFVKKAKNCVCGQKSKETTYTNA